MDTNKANKIAINSMQKGISFKQAKALTAIEHIHTSSILNRTFEISDSEIEKEIKAVRKARKKP